MAGVDDVKPCLQAAAEVVYVPGLQGAESASLMGAVGVRLRAALRSPSAPLICSAARTAGLLHSHTGSAGMLYSIVLRMSSQMYE